MNLILIVLLILILFGGGGGYYAHSNYGTPGLAGVLFIVLIVVLALWVAGAF